MFRLFVYVSLVSTMVSASCYFHVETLPISMYAHQAILSAARNAVYLFGGNTGKSSGNRVNLNKVYKWDLSDPSSWFVEIGTTPPSTRFFYSWSKNAVLVNDKVFFIGIDVEDRSSGNIFVYDLNTEVFLSEPKTPMPYPSWWGCLTTNTTHIFMVGGDDESTTQRLPNIQVYDVAADTWQSQALDAGTGSLIIGAGGGGWYDQYCSLVGDALYVLGGYLGDAYIDGIYRIDPHTLEIEQLTATLPSPQGDGVSIYDGDHSLYLSGAYPYTQDVVAFDLDTLSVSTAAFQSQQLFATAPVLNINGSIYRFGGENNFKAFAEVEICDLPTDTPTAESPSKQPTVSPTSTPTTTPFSLPTSVSSQLPTPSPTKTPTHAPTSIPTAMPSNAVPTTVPSLRPTRTGNVFNNSTTTPTNSSTRPSPLPSNAEYGVNVTIQIDAVLPSNDTDELMDALYAYAQNTANATNCSERINVLSEIADDSKTVVKLSIITCSESIEQQFLVAFDATVLEYDIIGGIVAEAEVDEIEIEGIYSDSTGVLSTAQTLPADDDEKKKRYWYLVLLGVLLLIASVAGTGVVLWFVWRRKKSQDVRKDVAINMANAVELQKCDDNDDLVKVDADRQQRAMRATRNETAGRQVNSNAHQDDDQANRPQAGAASFSRAEGNVPGAIGDDDDDDDDQDDDLFGTYEQGATGTGITGDAPGAIGMNDHGGNLEQVGSEDMSNEPITAEGDDNDGNDDDAPITVRQQPQTIFIA